MAAEKSVDLAKHRRFLRGFLESALKFDAKHRASPQKPLAALQDLQLSALGIQLDEVHVFDTLRIDDVVKGLGGDFGLPSNDHIIAILNAGKQRCIVVKSAARRETGKMHARFPRARSRATG